jgi:hypothetical protein
MILNQYGRPVSGSRDWRHGRRGDQVDGFQMSNGAVVSEKASLSLHDRIASDSNLRDRIESAQKMTGKETLHMALIRHGDRNKKTNIDEIIKTNVRAGEKVVRARAENENLTESKKAYEKIAV